MNNVRACAMEVVNSEMICAQQNIGKGGKQNMLSPLCQSAKNWKSVSDLRN